MEELNCHSQVKKYIHLTRSANVCACDVLGIKEIGIIFTKKLYFNNQNKKCKYLKIFTNEHWLINSSFLVS